MECFRRRPAHAKHLGVMLIDGAFLRIANDLQNPIEVTCLCKLLELLA